MTLVKPLVNAAYNDIRAYFETDSKCRCQCAFNVGLRFVCWESCEVVVVARFVCTPSTL